MECPACDEATVVFRVPADLREYAPDGAEAAGLCPSCLALAPADGADVPGDPDEPDEADFARVIEAFPDGEAGVAMALAVGLLVESLALNREAVATLFGSVSDRGADPWLVLERLAASPTVDPVADLDRLRRQLDGLLR